MTLDASVPERIRKLRSEGLSLRVAGTNPLPVMQPWLLIDRGKGTPADDKRFSELSLVFRALLEQMGVGSELPTGFLPNDPERILCDTWQEAAEGW